ncbi:unnamed protein product [Prunus armeniaca]|uniref:Uncharacterized protein n=1 Tax=Prunus armeniaca TaxID=36596 RepID=A0A6J5UVD4_PRUAR|nr:unnamed protein product [Prunus armeniaca]
MALAVRQGHDSLWARSLELDHGLGAQNFIKETRLGRLAWVSRANHGSSVLSWFQVLSKLCIGAGLSKFGFVDKPPHLVLHGPCRSARTLEDVLMVVVVTLELGRMKFRGAGLGRLGALIKIFGFYFAVLVEAGSELGHLGFVGKK